MSDWPTGRTCRACGSLLCTRDDTCPTCDRCGRRGHTWCSHAWPVCAAHGVPAPPGALGCPRCAIVAAQAPGRGLPALREAAAKFERFALEEAEG